MTMNHSYYNFSFLRISAHSPKLEVADVEYNTKQIIEHLSFAQKEKCDIALFPELCLSGYTCADLFYQTALLEACEKALEKIIEATLKKKISCIVGLPVKKRGRLYNTAAFISGGNLLGLDS